MKDLILRYITMPMAVKILRDDKEKFKPSKVNVLYFDLIDSALNQLESDFNKLKVEMYSIFHLDVRYMGKVNGAVRYAINKKVTEFTSQELRDKTAELMREYLAKSDLENEERGLNK